MSTELMTIGFGQKGAERFVALLDGAQVTVVVDIRRRPDSPLSGYARQRDLPFLLRSAAAIGYEHRLELAPPDELMDRYRVDRDWDAYVRDFDRVLRDPDAVRVMGELGVRGSSETVALLCSEPSPEKCHRRLVSERMQELDPTLEVRHLT
jgi:uncharacterized protein (DUF488 family)